MIHTQSHEAVNLREAGLQSPEGQLRLLSGGCVRAGPGEGNTVPVFGAVFRRLHRVVQFPTRRGSFLPSLVRNDKNACLPGAAVGYAVPSCFVWDHGVSRIV